LASNMTQIIEGFMRSKLGVALSQSTDGLQSTGTF